MAILISDKIYFKTQIITTDKDRNYKILKVQSVKKIQVQSIKEI